jgi:hypothetical protein
MGSRRRKKEKEEELPFRQEGDRFAVVLPAEAREAIRDLAGQYRELLRDQDPSSDPGVARLFPPARDDDPLANLEFENTTHAGLVAERLKNISIVERTAGDESVSQDDLLAWMAVANDLRLVLGTRLEVTEESTLRDFARDPERRETFAMYQFLSALVGTIIEALPEPVR